MRIVAQYSKGVINTREAWIKEEGGKYCIVAVPGGRVIARYSEAARAERVVRNIGKGFGVYFCPDDTPDIVSEPEEDPVDPDPEATESARLKCMGVVKEMRDGTNKE